MSESDVPETACDNVIRLASLMPHSLTIVYCLVSTVASFHSSESMQDETRTQDTQAAVPRSRLYHKSTTQKAPEIITRITMSLITIGSRLPINVAVRQRLPELFHPFLTSFAVAEMDARKPSDVGELPQISGGDTARNYER